MARVPEITRRLPISQVAASAPQSGQGFAALSQMLGTAASFIKPLAADQARRNGEGAVYRDENGVLRVEERSPLGGEMAAIHNSAAYGKYLGQKKIDVMNTMRELYTKYEFDPQGFQQAADGYIALLRDDENIPSVLKEDLIAGVQDEAANTFNGLYRNQVQRDYREADVSSKTARDMLVDDYVNLYVSGDTEAAEKKWQEIMSISQFREDAPYISETGAEKEDYLRGARGAAKAAKLIRELEDLDGATSLSDEKRAEIMGVLEDEDISPSVRQKLYTATNGRIKSIDANAFVAGIADSSYEAMVVRSESGGKNAAANPNSTALGPHQFLKSTWLNLIERYQPEWAQGLNTTQRLALRADRQKSSEMFAHFRRENQSALARAGIPVNPATEYLAHFFGSGGAINVLSKSADTLVSDIVPASVIKANKFLTGMTVRDVTRWAGRKMTMKASDLANLAVDVNQIEDPEVRGMAASALSERIKARTAIEQAAASTFEERIVNADNSLSIDEVLDNNDLSTSDQGSLIRAINKMREDQTEMQNVVANLENTDFSWNIYDSNQKTQVDKAYTAATRDMDPMSDEALGAAASIANTTGFMPRTAFNALRAAVSSNDPATLARSMEYLGALKARTPTAYQAYDGHGTMDDMLSDYTRLARFRSPEEAAQAMIDRRVDPPKNVTDQAKKLVADLSISDISDHFDDFWFSGVDLGSQMEQDTMMGEYADEFQAAYLETGDFDLAKGRALDNLARVYGPNMVTGSKRVMKFPPQAFYPAVNGSQDWMREQIEQEVSIFAFGGEAKNPKGSVVDRLVDGMSLGGAHDWVRAENIKLVSDAQTKAEIDKGTAPSYQVYFMRDGRLEVMPQRFFFDPSALQAEVKTTFEMTRDQIIADELETLQRQRELTGGILKRFGDE